MAAVGSLAAGLPVRLFSAEYHIKRDRWGETLPLNELGKTRKFVTLLGAGGFHIGRMTDYEAEKTIETAIGGGIRFFDAAESYVRGENEVKYGKYLCPKYRDEIFLMTKTKARDADTALSHLEGSLTRMKTDFVDLWLIHQVDSKDDFDRLRTNRMLDVFIKAKEKGLVRHIGFSGHTSPDASRYVLQQAGGIIEANMLPVNVVDPGYNSFIREVIPELENSGKGIIGMKSLSGGAFWGGGFEGQRKLNDRVIDHISVKDAIHFSLSMPVDVLVTGAADSAMLQEKIDLAKSFVKLPADEQDKLIEKVARFSGRTVEYYKA